MTMWNQQRTDAYDAILSETLTINGHNGDPINAYISRPLGPGPFPGIVLIHHLPGWDEFYKETARRFAHHGYITISPNLYARTGQGTPDEITAKAREAGGVSDEQVVGDCQASLNLLRAQNNCSGKVGVIGSCSGGRHAYVVACKTKAFDAVVNLWGGGVVMKPEDLTPPRPVNPLDMTSDLNCPILGLFGNDDQAPSPDQVNQLEAELKKQGKQYEFHRYDGAGHGFFYYDRALYRQEQAMDGWGKVFTFFGQHLGGK